MGREGTHRLMVGDAPPPDALALYREIVLSVPAVKSLIAGGATEDAAIASFDKLREAGFVEIVTDGERFGVRMKYPGKGGGRGN